MIQSLRGGQRTAYRVIRIVGGVPHLMTSVPSRPITTRSRVRAAVDRRFTRARVDAARAAEADLAALLRDEADAHAVIGALVAPIERTMQPASRRVRIRGVGR